MNLSRKSIEILKWEIHRYFSFITTTGTKAFECNNHPVEINLRKINGVITTGLHEVNSLSVGKIESTIPNVLEELIYRLYLLYTELRTVRNYNSNYCFIWGLPL
jgi:hypothetical protein